VTEEERQRKIAEIRHTGKTWQWPDVIERRHRKWTSEHLVVLGWVALTVVALVVLVVTW
jgi:hypothetical protein